MSYTTKLPVYLLVPLDYHKNKNNFSIPTTGS